MASRSGTKRGRKDKGVAPSSSDAPPPPSRFLDPEAQAKFSQYRFKQVKFGRVVDVDSNLNANGLNVQTLLEFQGLDKFLATAIGVFPTLVQEFYANLRHPLEGSGRPIRNMLMSRVNGIDFEFSEKDLAVALELDTFDDSLNIYKYSDTATLDPDLDLLEALNTICHTPQAHTGNIRDSSLKLPCHIIHRILVHSINPRSGSYDQCPKIDIYYVWAIFTQKRINWPGLLFYLFKNGAKRKDANLVFGLALSKLFAYYNAISGADVVKLSSDDYFTETTIQRFGYHVVDGSWVRKAGAAQHEADPQIDPIDQDVAEEMDAEPSGPPIPTNLDLMMAIQNMTARMDLGFQGINTRMDVGFQNMKDAFHFYHPEYHFPDDPPADA